MAKSRDDKPSEWHVDTKGIGPAAVGKIRKKDECLHIRAECIRTRIPLKNARCISKSVPRRNFLFSPEETETRRHVRGCALTYAHANSRTFSERGSLCRMRGNDSERSFNTSVPCVSRTNTITRTYTHTYPSEESTTKVQSVEPQSSKASYFARPFRRVTLPYVRLTSVYFTNIQKIFCYSNNIYIYKLNIFTLTSQFDDLIIKLRYICTLSILSSFNINDI